jgi:hypothetical protein
MELVHLWINIPGFIYSYSSAAAAAPASPFPVLPFCLFMQAALPPPLILYSYLVVAVDLSAARVFASISVV